MPLENVQQHESSSFRWADSSERIVEEMRVGVVYYYVRDLDRALGFYRDKLGLECIDLRLNVSNRWAELRAGGVTLGLEEVSKRGASYRPPWGGAVASFQVQHIEKAKADLEAKGVHFTTDILTFEKVKLVQFEDPDDNRLELHERI